MTNAMIISQRRNNLIASGAIKPEEEIHTYAGWKDLGYQVQRGQHAVDSFVIWKHVTRKSKKDDEPDESVTFQTMAHFFSTAQVQPIKKGG